MPRRRRPTKLTSAQRRKGARERKGKVPQRTDFDQLGKKMEFLTNFGFISSDRAALEEIEEESSGSDHETEVVM